MIQSETEHTAISAIISSSAWAILEREYKERAARYLREALDGRRSGLSDTTIAQKLDMYSAIKELGQLPYALLRESQFIPHDMQGDR